MSDETSENPSEAGDAVALSEIDPEEGRAAEDDAKSAPEDRETAGPFDASEVPAMRPYVDLGGVKIAPREGLQLRLEVDERSKRVVAVTLEYADSVLQLQAFSAPKSSGLWHGVRREIAQQFASQGSSVQEESGAFGPELAAAAPVPAEQGGGTRAVRFVGVDGPRWLLRGAIMGRATGDSEARAKVDELFRDTVIVRGDQPMPPSELLPLSVPAGVQPNGQAAAGGSA
ncbi:DUF3710 domain-containing protein [Leucobacter weissii]|uniref:DUF3710 domain-containing protein n=1 Tax=Leucobacter weissii TaxID=1983706 RepID=A0A939SAE9_9MICO|nr:DUF3710 domain-containing protein [Leucobacter weissii]MBO1901872.1 DUF3710 domain-containing protein [Leucobacter weissii]